MEVLQKTSAVHRWRWVQVIVSPPWVEIRKVCSVGWWMWRSVCQSMPPWKTGGIISAALIPIPRICPTRCFFGCQSLRGFEFINSIREAGTCVCVQQVPRILPASIITVDGSEILTTWVVQYMGPIIHINCLAGFLNHQPEFPKGIYGEICPLWAPIYSP